jgi:hypothetical protein
LTLPFTSLGRRTWTAPHLTPADGGRLAAVSGATTGYSACRWAPAVLVAGAQAARACGDGTSGSGRVCTNRPGRAPGLLAGGRVNSGLALVHDAVCSGVRSRCAVWAQARLSWARQVIAVTAPWACHSGYAHDKPDLHTIAASCHRPRLKLEATHNWTFLPGPGLVCGASALMLAAQGLRHPRQGLRHWLTG